MVRFRYAIFLVASLTTVSAAYAESDLKPGSFIKQTKHWDSNTNKFLRGADKGEGEGCWQVLSRKTREVELKLISGVYKPWWSEEIIALNSIDTWFDTDAFIERNPKAAPLTMLKAIFETVDSCK